MKQSIFKKELSETGSVRKISGEVITTMNYGSKQVTGTQAVTHDDYSKSVPIHKVEIFIEGKRTYYREDLTSEMLVLSESKLAIAQLKKDLIFWANNEPAKTFFDQMTELFNT